MQTSIEWLIEQLDTINPTQIEYHQAIEQAKEIHKKEIIDSYNQGYREAEHDNFLVNNKKDISEYSNADNYYNQTFTNE